MIAAVVANVGLARAQDKRLGSRHTNMSDEAIIYFPDVITYFPAVKLKPAQHHLIIINSDLAS